MILANQFITRIAADLAEIVIDEQNIPATVGHADDGMLVERALQHRDLIHRFALAFSRAAQGQRGLFSIRHVRDLAVFAEFGAGLAHRLDHLRLHLQFGGEPRIGIDHLVGRNLE